MSLYASLFGERAKKDCPEHFQVRPFAQHVLDDALPYMESANDQSAADYLRQANGSGGYAGQATHPIQASQLRPSQPAPSPSQQPPNQSRHCANNDVVAINGSDNRRLQPVAAAPLAPPPVDPIGGQVQEWSERYDGSVANIQEHIQAVAGAVAMLDGVEHKLIAIKSELERIRSSDLRIDGDKVLVALQALSDYVNQAIGSVDDQCVNMLRDAKLEIKFAELAPRQEQAEGVALTMISIDALLNYKIKRAFAEGLVAEETPEFVEDISRIVSSNIQILTAILLSLFASRDYTQAVVKFAERESIVPHVAHQARDGIAAPTIDRLQFDRVDKGGAVFDDELQAGRASLSELLKKVQNGRGELGSPGI